MIPNNPTRKPRHRFDRAAHRLRNLIERAFCRPEDWRRIATRYDKLAANLCRCRRHRYLRHLVVLIESRR